MSGPRVNYVGAPRYLVGALTYYVGSSTFNVGAQTPPVGVWSGPRDKYVGTPTYYVWAPTCYAGPETIMSGPRLIMSEPLLMSGPRDNYVGAPFLLFWSSEIIILGPDLLRPGPEIIMWEPRLCWVPHLSCRDPEIWGPWLIMTYITNKISYLGLVFSSNGFFKNSQATLADQASKALFQLHKTLHKFKNVPVSLTLDLFDKFISPILNYASEVWGFHSAPEIERIHLTFCKNILGVKKTTQNDFVYGLLGRHPLQIDRYCKIMKYWLKIVSGAKPFYVNTVYHASKLRANLDSSYN